jgi:hypothetical protein
VNRYNPPHAERPQAPDSVALSDIRQSAGRLARNDETLARQLHEEMVQLVPGSALPLAFDMEAFCRSMARMLLWTALTDQPGHVVVDVLRQAGGQHCLDGFPNDEYASVAHALVQSVRYLTDDWSASLGSAWVTFFLWARLHLLDGARVAVLSRPPETVKASRAATSTSSQVVSPLDDDEDAGSSQIIVSMTRNPREPRNLE